MVEAQYEASLHNLHEHRMYSHTPYVHINSFIDIHVPYCAVRHHGAG